MTALPVVVTGAAGDIGSAVCQELSGGGFAVVGTDRSTGGRSSQLLDAADPEACEEVLAGLAARLGPLFGLVNCAGVYEALAAETTTAADMERVWRGNVMTAWAASTAFARHARDGARIVNLASISGRHGSADVAYGTAKGGVIALTKSLAVHLAPRIAVNAVSPGVVEGAMASRIPPERREAYRTGNLVRRLGQPAEVAALVAALLGPAGAWMTGSVLDIDGGVL